MVMSNQIDRDICTLSLDRLTMQISVSLKADLVKRIDDAAGTDSRSGFITRCIYEHFEPPKNELEADKTHLTEQLNAYKDTQKRLENEVEYLRLEYSKINDALAQRLLTENTPKKSFWARIRGH